MKINDKILSIPPFLSTSWQNIAALKMEGSDLIIVLFQGGEVKVSGLANEIVEAIFTFHQKALETKTFLRPPATSIAEGFINQADQALRFGVIGMEAIGNAMQHSFEMRDAPALPPEILSKVEAVARVIAPDMKTELPKAEPHCNCPHCQIARAMQRGLGVMKEEVPPQNDTVPVPTEELQFEEWKIEQAGDQLFTVSNKLDANEKYNVFLGNPVGCTCGKTGCDHILAVLRS